MRENEKHHTPVLEDVEIIVALVGMGIVCIAWFIAHERYHLPIAKLRNSPRTCF